MTTIDERLIKEIVLQVLKAQQAEAPQKKKEQRVSDKFLKEEQTCPILFGTGALNTVGEQVAELGCKKVLLVTDPGIIKLGLAEKVEGLLRRQGVTVVIYDNVRPNPEDSACNQGGEAAVREGVDGIVAIGGGSVMDTGKAIRILSANPAPISKYYGTMDYKPGMHLILIPTTAGTGSESTKYAVLTDSVTHEKKVALGTGSLAICDPELTYSLPPALTAATGMDVLAHACESYAGGVHNPKADILALAAISRIMQWLPKAYRGEDNEKARYEVMIACSFAGMAFNETLCHLGHSVAHSIGATFNIPHGSACAWALPETMVFCAGLYPERLRDIAEAMGISCYPGMPPETVGKKVADAIRGLMRTLGIKSLKELGIEREQVIGISGLVMKDFCYPIIPITLNETQIKEFLGKVYDTYQ